MELREKVFNILISALVSAVVAFGVGWYSGKHDMPRDLSLRTLEIEESLTLRSPEDSEEVVVLRNDGVVFAKNKVLSEHYMGNQFSGHLFLGNRVLVSPNDLFKTPAESLVFLGELGINAQSRSGELVIRSPQGGNVVGKGVQGGQYAQIGFDRNDFLHFLVFDNAKQSTRFIAGRGTPDSPGGEESEIQGFKSKAAPRLADQIHATE